MEQITIKEFREFGYLQEVNRQFLHPLGLALEVTCDDDGTYRLSGVWDCRDSSDGIYFGALDAEKTKRVIVEQEHRGAIRQRSLGYNIQPPYDIDEV